MKLFPLGRDITIDLDEVSSIERMNKGSGGSDWYVQCGPIGYCVPDDVPEGTVDDLFAEWEKRQDSFADPRAGLRRCEINHGDIRRDGYYHGREGTLVRFEDDIGSCSLQPWGAMAFRDTPYDTAIPEKEKN